jgi:hypothetical protein
MIKMAGNIEILCGALADQAAREVERSGIFTRKLLEVLAQPHEPPLLALPLDLDAWHRALPANLLDQGIHILGTRDVLGAARTQHDPQPNEQTALDLSVAETERSVTGEPRDGPEPRRSQQSAA